MTFPLDAVTSGWVGIAALGGLLALDGTSVGQTMVSRPLVAGVLTGMLVGEPMFGAVIGAVLELYLLVSFPTGGARFPEGATATVVAVGSTPGFEGGGALALAVAAGLVWGHVGGMSVTLLRRANERLVPGGDPRPTTPARVVVGHLAALCLDFLRGGLIVATGLLVGRTLIVTLGPTWPLGVSDSFGLMLVGASVSLGILLRGFGGFQRNRLRLAVGIALGLLGAQFL